jgi:hypothetical protein
MRLSPRACDDLVQRVEREVAALGVLLQRDLRVDDDLEVAVAGTGRLLAARQRDLDVVGPADAVADVLAVAQDEVGDLGRPAQRSRSVRAYRSMSETPRIM